MHAIPFLRRFAAIAVWTFNEMDRVRLENAAQRAEAERINAEGRERMAFRRARARA